ncbi:MAB_1171c family putative transporter [Streptomyces virginiae]
MSDLSFFGPALLGALAFLIRLPGLLRNPRDPLLRAVAMLLLTASGVFLFGSIPMIAKVNETTGVANISAPLVYSILTAFSGSCIVLLINWRGGSAARIRHATRWCVGTYGLVIVALFGLFALGSAPVERLRDLDTYYANTPYIREMIVLYLVAHTASSLVMTSLCRRWSREVDGELRTGLYLMVFGYLVTVAYDVCKFSAVGARWAGQDWDFLSTDIARPLASVASPFVAIGFGLPLVVQRLKGPWWDWKRHRELGPLWRLVQNLAPDHKSPRISLFAPPGVRVLQRESDIHDGFLTLNPYFDRGLRDAARADALASGAAPHDADAYADAVMLTAAKEALLADPGHQVIASSEALQEGPGGDSLDLARISQALCRHSPVGAVIRQGVAHAG